ncbi:hypothetical protein ACH9DO_16505 [Kocuria sp. M1N1S27]|uniref:hypothetical protein n=1 Tax=Kocuria kalidii TaxID=3376283 RepID=UPI0037BA71E4
MMIHDRGSTRVLSATLVAVAALGLAGCNEDDPVPADGEPVGVSAPEVEETLPEEDENRVTYEGQYNQEFIDEAANYVGQQVTLSGLVTGTLSPGTFAIAGPADPMLIVEEQEIPAVDEGQTVELTGIMRENFSVTEVEEQLGVELDDELYTDFEGENYLAATQAQISDQE